MMKTTCHKARHLRALLAEPIRGDPGESPAELPSDLPAPDPPGQVFRSAEPQDLVRSGWYASYLASEAWKEKRRLVLIRDRHRCQSCGVRKATEIHHLTYRNLTREFLFELIALCSECHARFHGVDVDQIDTQ